MKARPLKNENSSPRRILYTLAEAAIRAECTSEDILEHASQGEILLCVSVPDDAVVFSMASDALRPASRDVYSFKKLSLDSALMSGPNQEKISICLSCSDLIVKAFRHAEHSLKVFLLRAIGFLTNQS